MEKVSSKHVWKHFWNFMYKKEVSILYIFAFYFNFNNPHRINFSQYNTTTVLFLSQVYYENTYIKNWGFINYYYLTNKYHLVHFFNL